MPIISVQKCGRGRDWKNILPRLLRPVGGADFYFCQGERISILPDWGLPLSLGAGVNTDPSLLRELSRLAIDKGAAEVKICLRSAKEFSFSQVLNLSGYHELADEQGVKLVNLDEDDYLQRDADQLGKFYLAKSCLDCDLLISVPKFRAEGQLLFGGAIKNLEQILKSSGDNQENYKARALTGLLSIVKPDLIIADCMLGSANYQPLKSGALLAASDPFAMDTVLAALAGISAEQIDYLCLAAQYGLGSCQAGDITISGDDLMDIINY